MGDVDVEVSPDGYGIIFKDLDEEFNLSSLIKTAIEPSKYYRAKSTQQQLDRTAKIAAQKHKSLGHSGKYISEKQAILNDHFNSIEDLILILMEAKERFPESAVSLFGEIAEPGFIAASGNSLQCSAARLEITCLEGDDDLPL